MDAVFVQKSPPISLYVRSIHLYEIWNRLPPYEQFCNSNTNDNRKSPKSAKSSPKKSPKKGGAANQKVVDEEAPKPEYEPAIITGVVAVHKSRITNEKKLYVEVTARFRYVGHSRVPPFPDNVSSDCQCYREVTLLYPINFDIEMKISEFNQQLIFKLRNSLGRGYRFFPFYFDITRRPDSLFFTRPYYPDYSSGLFWKLRTYIAREENCSSLPEEEISMEFFKYTICPALSPSSLRPAPPVEYKRFATAEDTGDLILQAQLERDIYYHGQEIKVKIQIENNSARHVVHSIAVFVEQTYRLFHQFPHDSSIPLGEVLLKAGEAGLPINPKNRNWNREVLVKPRYDATKYNLAIDGRMPVDNKIFLASSTVIMMGKQVPVITTEEPEKKQPSPKGSPKERKNSPKGKSPPKSKKSPKRDKSPDKGTQKASPEKAPETEELPPEEPRTIVTMTEVNTLTNKQSCRSAAVAYDVVVRLNIKTPTGDEAGHPMVRLPFILTRETRFLDKFANPPPPTWAIVLPH
ncbi:beta-arrestin [Clonorchis sinensis]|uniref:Beta-arrestin n=1 Tax=Clonorchis sinensis TaxID=79923 RepID=G7YBS8_CLOSI|nr:beta-arrestin [Clonorchis sinensis]